MSAMSLTAIIFIIGYLTAVHAGVVAPVSPALGKSFSKVQGTFWTGATYEGSCLLQNYQRPENLEYVAINRDVNGHAEYCGTCISITPNPPNGLPAVTAIVSSHCANCPPAALDIPESLYNRLMTDKPGRPGLAYFDWKSVACPLGDKKPAVVNKTGSSKWHLSMMVADSKFPIASVVILSEGKSINAHKTDYNYWELSDSLTLSDRVTVKVTCVNNGSFLVEDVDPSSMTPTMATSDCGSSYSQHTTHRHHQK